MLIIQEILISDAIIEEQFLCNLTACKGACCWEGDYGAPLETDELNTLEEIYGEIEPFLTKEGRRAISKNGLFKYYEEPKEYGTPLIKSKACVFTVFDQNGTAKCGIEEAHLAGATDFKKPISCHLYPIRVSKNIKTGFEALNYDRWDICSAACALGKKEQLPVFKFLKEALVRKYGAEFYEELEAAAGYLK